MQSIDSLCDAIEAFPGSVVLVTHSEMLLHRLADQLIVFRHHGAEFFDGNYEAFLEKIGWDEEEGDEKPAKVSKASGVNKKELKRQRSELIAARGKAINPLKKRIEACESRIIELEEEVETDNALLIEASQSGDVGEIQFLSKKVAEAHEEIERLFAELEEAEVKLDERSAHYDKALEAL
jgi:ATP-binding cassette subfamily F protein 3